MSTLPVCAGLYFGLVLHQLYQVWLHGGQSKLSLQNSTSRRMEGCKPGGWTTQLSLDGSFWQTKQKSSSLQGIVGNYMAALSIAQSVPKCFFHCNLPTNPTIFLPSKTKEYRKRKRRWKWGMCKNDDRASKLRETQRTQGMHRKTRAWKCYI